LALVVRILDCDAFIEAARGDVPGEPGLLLERVKNLAG
jgi:hypothetical protein